MAYKKVYMVYEVKDADAGVHSAFIVNTHGTTIMSSDLYSE